MPDKNEQTLARKIAALKETLTGNSGRITDGRAGFLLTKMRMAQKYSEGTWGKEGYYVNQIENGELADNLYTFCKENGLHKEAYMFNVRMRARIWEKKGSYWEEQRLGAIAVATKLGTLIHKYKPYEPVAGDIVYHELTGTIGVVDMVIQRAGFTVTHIKVMYPPLDELDDDGIEGFRSDELRPATRMTTADIKNGVYVLVVSKSDRMYGSVGLVKGDVGGMASVYFGAGEATRHYLAKDLIAVRKESQ